MFQLLIEGYSDVYKFLLVKRFIQQQQLHLSMFCINARQGSIIISNKLKGYPKASLVRIIESH